MVCISEAVYMRFQEVVYKGCVYRLVYRMYIHGHTAVAHTYGGGRCEAMAHGTEACYVRQRAHKIIERK